MFVTEDLIPQETRLRHIKDGSWIFGKSSEVEILEPSWQTVEEEIKGLREVGMLKWIY